MDKYALFLVGVNSEQTEYEARELGVAVAVYDAQRDPSTQERPTLLSELHSAIERSELQLYCQPKANMRSGQLAGAERQRRSDEPTVNAAARRLNSLGVRNAELARRCMHDKEVPYHVVVRVLSHPELHRWENTGQSLSEAITPSAPNDS